MITIQSDSWNEINNNECLYLSILPLLFFKENPCILNPHGMLSSQAFSVKPLKKKFFLKIADLLRLYRNVIFHVSNEEEASAVRKHIKNYKSITIASQFTREVPSDLLINSEKNSPVRFVNLARVSIEKGTLKMINALRNVEQALQLDMYGPVYDTAYWSLCQRAIANLPSHISVNYRGIVHSNEVLKILSYYDYFVLLSEGENFGHAIFEAFSVGLPVIISDNTPWRNLEEKNIGWDVDLEDNKKIESIVQTAILKSNKEYMAMSNSAIEFARIYANDEKLIKSNLEVFVQ